MSDEHEAFHRCEECRALDSEANEQRCGDDLRIWEESDGPYLVLNSVESGSFPFQKNRVAL